MNANATAQAGYKSFGYTLLMLHTTGIKDSYNQAIKHTFDRNLIGLDQAYLHLMATVSSQSTYSVSV